MKWEAGDWENSRIIDEGKEAMSDTIQSMKIAAPSLSGWGRFKQRGREALTNRGRELMAYASCYSRSRPAGQARVVIFAQGRTGSTLLESLLASSGHFRAHGELLNCSRGEVVSPLRYIRGLSKRQPGNFIFHVKVYQLTRDRKRPIDPAAFIKTLHEEGWKILYLRRENKVKHVLSNIVAHARGRYHKQNDERERIQVAIDCGDFARGVRERLAFEEREREVLRDVPHHEVVYETDLERSDAQQRTADGVFDFLGLERRAVSTSHRKVNTTPVEELISNYDEVLRCLEENGWRGFVEG